MQPPPVSEEESLGTLVRDLAEQASLLVHAEVRLAEAKLAQRVRMAGVAIILLAAAGSFGFIVLLTVMFALGAFLAQGMGPVAAAGVVALASAVIAGILFYLGRARFQLVFGGDHPNVADEERLV